MLQTWIRHVQRHIMVFIPNRLELIDRYRLKLDDGDQGIILQDEEIIRIDKGWI